MNMKTKRIIIAAAAAVLLGACSGTEKTEEITSEIEAAQMQGRTDAREFVNREWKDSMELQKHLLEAKARQSKYLLDKKPEAAEAYDSAFVNTIRSVRPDIADQLK